MIEAAHRRRFRERGIVKVDGLIPASAVAPARELVQGRLREAGAWREGRWLGDADPASLKRLKTCSKSAAFKGLSTADVHAAARDLIEAGPLVEMKPTTQLLFTPPNAEEWTVPHNVWHLDLPRLGIDKPPGVQLFTFLDAVQPRGGGTLLVAGSHRLLNDQGVIGSRGVKNRLRKTPYFRELMDRHATRRSRLLHEQAQVGDVTLQVVELHGQPGDVYFTDPRLLHSLGPNATAKPRIMVTQRFLLKAVGGELERAYAELRRFTKGASREHVQVSTSHASIAVGTATTFGSLRSNSERVATTPRQGEAASV